MRKDGFKGLQQSWRTGHRLKFRMLAGEEVNPRGWRRAEDGALRAFWAMKGTWVFVLSDVAAMAGFGAEASPAVVCVCQGSL